MSAQEKAALLAEIDAEGGKVRLVARRHQILESLFYNWRSARKAAAVAIGAPENFGYWSADAFERAADAARERATALAAELEEAERDRQRLVEVEAPAAEADRLAGELADAKARAEAADAKAASPRQADVNLHRHLGEAVRRREENRTDHHATQSFDAARKSA